MTADDTALWLYRIVSCFMDAMVIAFSSRVFWEVFINAKSRKIETILHVPLIFYAFVHSGGFLLQQLLLIWEWTCRDEYVLLTTHIGTFGGFGFLPGLYVSVYIPYLVFKKSERLQIVDMFDVLMAFLFTLVGTTCAWGLSLARDGGSVGLKVAYMHCSIKFSTTALMICMETLIFSVSISILWLYGLKIYFQAVYNDEDINAVDVLKRVSVVPENMRRMSIASRFSEISRASFEQHGDSFSVSNNHHNDEFEQQITKVVETYGAEFRRCWMFTMMNLSAYCGAIMCELAGFRIGPLWFIGGFVIKLCGCLSCYLFFQSKIMLSQKRTLIPTWLFFCKGWVNLQPIEGRMKRMTARDSTPAILRPHYVMQQFYE